MPQWSFPGCQVVVGKSDTDARSNNRFLFEIFVTKSTGKLSKRSDNDSGDIIIFQVAFKISLQKNYLAVRDVFPRFRSDDQIAVLLVSERCQ